VTPRVSFHTAQILTWLVTIPLAGTVCHGKGKVWENLTCDIPILNPDGYNLPCAKEIFDNFRARGAERILHPRLYTSFVEAYLDMALKEPDQKFLWESKTLGLDTIGFAV
jgi:hypothetical protein